MRYRLLAASAIIAVILGACSGPDAAPSVTPFALIQNSVIVEANHTPRTVQRAAISTIRDGTGVLLSFPGAPRVGDTIFASFIARANSNDVYSAPYNFKLEWSGNSANGKLTQRVYSHRVVSGENNSFYFSIDGADAITGNNVAAFELSGVDATNRISSFAAYNSQADNVNQVSSLGILPQKLGSLAISFFGSSGALAPTSVSGNSLRVTNFTTATGSTVLTQAAMVGLTTAQSLVTPITASLDWQAPPNDSVGVMLILNPENVRIAGPTYPTLPPSTPTPLPTSNPTASPTPYATIAPTPSPTPVPTPTPTPVPTVAPTVAPTLPPVATPVPTMAPTVAPSPSYVSMSAYRFNQGIGANTHPDHTDGQWQNYQYVLDSLKALNFKNYRVSLDIFPGANNKYANFVNTLGAAGLRADLLIGGPNQNSASVYQPKIALINKPSYVRALEGPNELDVCCGDSQYIAHDNYYAQQLIPQLLASGYLANAGIKKYSPTLANTDGNVLGPYDSTIIDYVNAHDYVGGFSPENFGYGGSQYTDPTTGVTYNYGDVRNTFAGAQRMAPSVTQRVATEFGIPTVPAPSETPASYQGHVPDNVQAAYLERYIGYHAILGITEQYLYDLFDEGFGSADHYWGLVRADGTQKPSYRALQGFLNILSDSNDVANCNPPVDVQGPAPGSPAYGKSGFKHLELGLCKANGEFDLVVWSPQEIYNVNSKTYSSLSSVNVSITARNGFSPTNVGVWSQDANYNWSYANNTLSNLSTFAATEKPQIIVFGGPSNPTPLPALPTAPPTPSPTPSAIATLMPTPAPTFIAVVPNHTVQFQRTDPSIGGCFHNPGDCVSNKANKVFSSTVPQPYTTASGGRPSQSDIQSDYNTMHKYFDEFENDDRAINYIYRSGMLGSFYNDPNRLYNLPGTSGLANIPDNLIAHDAKGNQIFIVDNNPKAMTGDLSGSSAITYWNGRIDQRVNNYGPDNYPFREFRVDDAGMPGGVWQYQQHCSGYFVTSGTTCDTSHPKIARADNLYYGTFPEQFGPYINDLKNFMAALHLPTKFNGCTSPEYARAFSSNVKGCQIENGVTGQDLISFLNQMNMVIVGQQFGKEVELFNFFTKNQMEEYFAYAAGHAATNDPRLVSYLQQPTDHDNRTPCLACAGYVVNGAGAPGSANVGNLSSVNISPLSAIVPTQPIGPDITFPGTTYLYPEYDGYHNQLPRMDYGFGRLKTPTGAYAREWLMVYVGGKAYGRYAVVFNPGTTVVNTPSLSIDYPYTVQVSGHGVITEFGDTGALSFGGRMPNTLAPGEAYLIFQRNTPLP